MDAEPIYLYNNESGTTGILEKGGTIFTNYKILYVNFTYMMRHIRILIILSLIKINQLKINIIYIYIYIYIYILLTYMIMHIRILASLSNYKPIIIYKLQTIKWILIFLYYF
jgi:hypothetical protein